MARIKPRAPPAFKPQVLDTEKRLNILFDALNNEELKPEVVEGLGEIVKALQGKQFDAAAAGLTELQRNHEGGAWMVSATVPLLLSRVTSVRLIARQTGIKRLIQMSRATGA